MKDLGARAEFTVKKLNLKFQLFHYAMLTNLLLTVPHLSSVTPTITGHGEFLPVEFYEPWKLEVPFSWTVPRVKTG